LDSVHNAPRILIVGAGALGQVFSSIFEPTSSIAFLVKPAHESRIKNGFVVYQLTRSDAPIAKRVTPPIVLTNAVQAAAISWDQVWLCVHSTAFEQNWLRSLRDNIGSTTIVTVGQGLGDRATLEQQWPKEQIVQVVPSLFAYYAPLAKEVLPEPGVAYWSPPKSALEVSGVQDCALAVVDVLQQGGAAAKYVGAKNNGETVAALTMPFIIMLETCGWSIRALKDNLRGAAKAAREATRIVAIVQKKKAPSLLATSTITSWLALSILPRLAPFNLEDYARVHFAKIGPQTRQMLDAWIKEGSTRELPIKALMALRSRMR
jgi:2-dehydropantoate 2-reductase